jgi:hypothetical protein
MWFLISLKLCLRRVASARNLPRVLFFASVVRDSIRKRRPVYDMALRARRSPCHQASDHQYRNAYRCKESFDPLESFLNRSSPGRVAD